MPATLLLFILLALAGPAWSETLVEGSDHVAIADQPTNVGDAAAAAIAYRKSGAYEAGLAMVDAAAADWLKARAPRSTKPALILDVDETALSNWKIIRRDDFGRPIAGRCDLALDAPCGWAAWDQLGRDPAVQPTLSLFRTATSLNVAVFFITGRPESQRAATERNLSREGFDGFLKLFMPPADQHFSSAADFKAPVRAGIERDGYDIIANVGDQPSDLTGAHAEKSFLLPNPFYRVP